jgi:hypothetical protein
LEPAFHGALPAIVWKNIMTAYASKGLIDLSAGSGEGCKAAMSLRKPCLAFCFNDEHVRLLFDHLVEWMLENMADQKSVYFSQNYAAYKKSGSSSAANELNKVKVNGKDTPTPKTVHSRRKRSHSVESINQKDSSKKAKTRSRREASSSPSSA